MMRTTRTVALSLLCLALAGFMAAAPVEAQGKTDLSVALSSFATEVLDPALGGHLVKYYLSLQFDYLVEHGLKPGHRMLDIGCGNLRAGWRFIDYRTRTATTASTSPRTSWSRPRRSLPSAASRTSCRT